MVPSVALGVIVRHKPTLKHEIVRARCRNARVRNQFPRIYETGAVTYYGQRFTTDRHHVQSFESPLNGLLYLPQLTFQRERTSCWVFVLQVLERNPIRVAYRDQVN
jgi:hypothetical protein